MITRRVIHALLFAVFTLVSPELIAGEYSYRIWRAEDGLPRNRIQAIEQTPDGYLWIATSGGLARFDGVRFVVFDSSNTPALHDESILSLLPARDGSLWAGTEGGGLVHYRKGEFTNFGAAEGLTNGFVRALAEDDAGNLWVGTDRGFFQMVNGRFVRLDHGTPESPFVSAVRIVTDKQQRVWVGTQAGLLTVSQGMIVPARCHGERMTAAVKGVYRMRDGTVFTIDAAGISEIRNGCRLRNPLVRDVSITAMREARDGSIWIGTLGEGVIRYVNGKPQKFTAPSVLPDNAVTAVFEDRGHDIWIGTQDGLALLSRTPLTTIDTDAGLADNHITAVSADFRGAAGTDQVWIATWSGQMYRIAGGKPIPFPLPGVDLREFKPHTMLEDSKGVLWLGSYNAGVMRLDHGRVTHLSMAEGLRTNDIRQFYEDAHGHIWFATGSGMTLWDGKARDGKSIRNYYLNDGLSYPSVHVVARNPGGGFLIGTDGGLNLVQNDRFVSVPAFAGLRQEKIWSILADPDGTLWLGTRGDGLFRLRNGRLTHYTSREGLISNAIFQILDDGKGKLWLSSPAGVSSVLREELNTADGRPGTLHAVPYGTSDGMLTSEMSGSIQPAGARSGSGALWLPSLKGVVRIDPSSLPQRAVMPVLIEQVVANGRVMPLSGSIEIPPGSGKLQIDYTACFLAAPGRLSFQYKLEGFDERWISALRSRSASYTNLSPGRYRFVVRATDATFPLHYTEAALSLDLLPAFYRTTWFFGLCGVGLGLSVFAGTRIYARHTRSRYALLLAERTRLARE
ncbi:MAG TPA: two-component regulator propeller domain-containing protein, partial [Bryobacteraceae bacterium]|nr:two-component regulator propeller domain-containing protein [Bryobacteraceae bacterium]